MSRIRPFKYEDLSDVAKMVTNGYRGLRGRDVSIAIDSMEEIFFQNPWENEINSSLVYEDLKGNIKGFIGLSPRSMKFKGSKITLLVFHNFVVENESSLVGVQMLKKLFEGSHDLIIGDATSVPLKNVWTSLGGTIGYTYSYKWTIPIHPIVNKIGIGYLRRKLNTPLLYKLLKPTLLAGEELLGKLKGAPYQYNKPDGYTKEITIEQLSEYIQKFTTHFSLQPDYTPDNLNWLLKVAEYPDKRGKFKYIGVYDSNDELAGWFIFFPNPGGTSKVILMHSINRKESLVVDHLVFLNQEAGAINVYGQLEPPFIDTLRSRYCNIAPGPWILLHGKNPELIFDIISGKTYLSKLETNLWMF